MTTIPILEEELKEAYRDLKYYKNYSERLKNQLHQKENIIKEVEKFVEEVLSSTKGVVNDYMYHEQHNKERIELLKEDIEIYKHILEILDKRDEK